MDAGLPASPHVALFPSPGVGHITPLLELGRRLVSLHGLRATIFLPPAAHPSAAGLHQLFPHSLSLPEGLRIVELLLPGEESAAAGRDVPDDARVETRISLTVGAALAALRSALREASPPPSVLVVDIFGTDAFDVAGDLGMAKYLFFTSTALLLALMLYMPLLDREVTGEYVDLPGPLQVPGCPPVHPADVVDPMIDRENEGYRWFLHHASLLPLADGVLINTVEQFDLQPLTALKKEPAFVDIIPTPPVYPIGPVVKTATATATATTTPPGGSKHESLEWLDRQPPGTVLFVSFGSGGTLSAEQTSELAWGLEQSRQRFLWVIRPPAAGDSSSNFFTHGGEDDPQGPASYLPEGFVGRTKGRGFLLPGWAPQVDILGHPAVGGFLTHGGWNSVLESIVAGLAMIVWPLYAEQKMNAARLSEEMKVAVRVRPEGGGGLVGREEVERAAKLLMEGDEGKAMRVRAAEARDLCTAALAVGGSSERSLAEAVSRWRRGGAAAMDGDASPAVLG